MLVLSRNDQESIMIGDDIEVRVVKTRPGRVRLGITLPAHIPVHRMEVWKAIQAEKQEAAEKMLGGRGR